MTYSQPMAASHPTDGGAFVRSLNRLFCLRGPPLQLLALLCKVRVLFEAASKNQEVAVEGSRYKPFRTIT